MSTSIQLLCDDCGVQSNDAYITGRYELSVSKPSDWGEVERQYSKHRSYTADLCPACFAKYKAEHPEVEW